MSDILAVNYGSVEGPLGFPMPDADAHKLDALLKALPSTPQHEYRHVVTTKAATDIDLGERSDVSWISSESPDRTREVVMAAGMDDSQFAVNPIVTLGHAYYLPPVGKSLWRKRVRDGGRAGVKAKTVYPARPQTWPTQDPWPSDQVFSLIQAGLLQGKSIGFLPLKAHVPDSKEVRKNGWADDVGLVIDEWLLLEYACVFLPANQDALVESVTKGDLTISEDVRQALGLNEKIFAGGTGDLPAEQSIIPFTVLDEIQRAVLGRIAAIDFQKLAEKTIKETWHKSIGRV